MARKFPCSNCDEDIIIKYILPGEPAVCESCGHENIAPDDIEIIPDDEYDKLHVSKAPAFEQKSEPETVTPATRVIVNDIRMSFGSMVVFMIKWALAAIPAMIILYIIGMIIVAMFAGFASTL